MARRRQGGGGGGGQLAGSYGAGKSLIHAFWTTACDSSTSTRGTPSSYQLELAFGSKCFFSKG